jgi:hypothetical protein
MGGLFAAVLLGNLPHNAARLMAAAFAITRNLVMGRHHASITSRPVTHLDEGSEPPAAL